MMRNPIRHSRFILVILLVLAGLPALTADRALAAGLAVTVHTAAEVSGEEVLLADIADIQGEDGALSSQLAELKVSVAPLPGRTDRIRGAQVEARLRGSGLPLDDIELNLPEQVMVSRAYQSIDAGWVRQIVEEYLAGHEPYRSGDWELVSLRTGTLPKLPEGHLDYQIMANASADPSYLGLTVFLHVDGRQAAQVRVSGRVNLFVQAVVAARMLERGQAIGVDDVKMARMSLSRMPRGVLTDPAAVEGLTVRRMIQAGLPVTDACLEATSVVSRGDVVTILAETGALRVVTRGEAKEDGAVGENISVLNLNSKKMVSARVVSPGTVRVNF